MKKSALGRGLGALIEDNEYQNFNNNRVKNKTINTIVNNELFISQIETNPFQPRLDFSEEQIEELARSIKRLGIIQPITVRKIDENKYQIISGERRFRATQKAGLDKIPAYIRQADDQAMLELALVENIQREDLNSIEIALTYRRLIEECDLTHEKLSDRIGKNRTTITNSLRLLKLPVEIQAGLRDKLLTAGHARALTSIDDEEEQMKIFDFIKKESPSVRTIEKMVAELQVKTELKEKRVVKIPRDYVEHKNSLTKKLKTNILLSRNEKGKGKLVIPFKSDAELERIFEVLNSK